MKLLFSFLSPIIFCLLWIFFHAIKYSSAENKRALQTVFSSMHIFLIFLFTGLKSVSFVIGISGTTKRGFVRSKVYLSIMTIGLIFSLCLHIKKHKNRTTCSRQGVVKYQCHTSYTTWGFFLFYHLLLALISLVPSQSECQTSIRILYLLLYLKPLHFHFSESGCHESELMTAYVCYVHDGHLVFQV